MLIFFYNRFFPSSDNIFQGRRGSILLRLHVPLRLAQLGLSLHFCTAAPLAPGCTGAQGQDTGQASAASNSTWGSMRGNGTVHGSPGCQLLALH